MLKISFSETPAEEKWLLHGRLTAPWVPELRACWNKNHRRDKQRPCIVDMNGITFVDKSGERLLRLLVREGAQCIATGDYTKHVLEKLTAKSKGSILNRLTGFLFGAMLAAFAVLMSSTTAEAQYVSVTGSVPSGPASDQVLRLTLRDTINMALKYNLGRSRAEKMRRLRAVGGCLREQSGCRRSVLALPKQYSKSTSRRWASTS